MILSLAGNPFAGKPLKGKFSGLYSLKVWPYRIIYLLSKTERTVQIVEVVHRQGVYK